MGIKLTGNSVGPAQLQCSSLLWWGGKGGQTREQVKGSWLAGWVDCQVSEQEGSQMDRRVGREEGRRVGRQVRVGWCVGRDSAGGGQADGQGISRVWAEGGQAGGHFCWVLEC